MKFLIESSKYDDKEKLLKECGEYVYHATSKKHLENIYTNGLENFWFGLDIDECIEFVKYNHDDYNYEDIFVLEIPTKMLNAKLCDFTVDSGDGWSDDWAGTGIYTGTISIKDLDSYWVEDDKWYYIKDLFGRKD